MGYFDLAPSPDRSDGATSTVASPSISSSSSSADDLPPFLVEPALRPAELSSPRPAGGNISGRITVRSPTSPSRSLGSSRSGKALAVCSASADKLASWLNTACLRWCSNSVSRRSCCFRHANSCWVRSLMAAACFFAVAIRASASCAAAPLLCSASARASARIRAASARSASRRSADSL